MTAALRAPFPYFGGKADAAPHVWAALGNPAVYVEPFFGSGAVLLRRPGGAGRIETVNDKDGFLSNLWRALKAAPAAVAEHADWPVNEVDQHARHLWLVGQRDSLTEKLIADPEYFDAKAAGWWVWGASLWIGSGWCSGQGGWSLEDGQLVSTPRKGISRKRPQTHHQGGGVHKPGVSRQVPQIASDGAGVHLAHRRSGLLAWFEQLAARLRQVKVCCGDWSRVLGPSATYKNLALTAYASDACGIFLDPPYSVEARTPGLYAQDDEVAGRVRAWCLKNGANPKLRVVLAGYEGEGHEPLQARGWRVVSWAPTGFFRGGYGNQSGASQQHRERLWLSPHCLEAPKQLSLVEAVS